MKKLNLFIVMLLLLSWTVSYAQTGKPKQDTIKCYGITELRHIASTIIQARSCDTLLANTKSMLANRDSLIILKDSEISNQHLQLVFKDKIIDVKEQQIIQLDKALAKSKLRSKLLNFGWGSASVVLTGFLVYFVIH
jgi:hypothetical protein